ncbi:hypothetical protein CPA40_05395 [Bifidobacterium callitrichos]|uniref:TraX protein n=1 Tax=Bifidobacterium callitrichos TaxID=762209 RepID=A0A2T3GAH4_9BIFI|nr:TraX family protein [Bifidobacterium callitrichos]PST46490.1 hypothetical protein CPA40_05395 [Bifidobacterium callitrichos]
MDIQHIHACTLFNDMNSFILKIIALSLMLVDHIAEFLPGMPVWMHWVGRLSAPIFFFLIGWSCVYTSNRKRFLTRLYVASVGMSIIQAASYVFVDTGFSFAYGMQPIVNNIFATLFQMSLIICLLSAPTARERLRNMSIYILAQIVIGAAMIFASGIIDDLPVLIVLQAVSGTVLGLEGGWLNVAIGVILWAVHGNRLHMSLAFIGMSLIYLASALPIAHRLVGIIMDDSPIGYITNFILNNSGISQFVLGQSPITVNYQWMMVFALPFMLLYNHQRGPHVKWFFYIFYPAHIVVLYLIGMVMNNFMAG